MSPFTAAQAAAGWAGAIQAAVSGWETEEDPATTGAAAEVGGCECLTPQRAKEKIFDWVLPQMFLEALQWQLLCEGWLQPLSAFGNLWWNRHKLHLSRFSIAAAATAADGWCISVGWASGGLCGGGVWSPRQQDPSGWEEQEVWQKTGKENIQSVCEIVL